MGKKRFSDAQMDRLLTETLASDAQPGERTVIALKRQLQQKHPVSRNLSLWWLPAFAGTAMSMCLVYAFSFFADWKCMTAMMAAAGVFVLSAWLLTIIGICKIKSFKEACKLV